jgi:hypothetical protein
MKKAWVTCQQPTSYRLDCGNRNLSNHSGGCRGQKKEEINLLQTLFNFLQTTTSIGNIGNQALASIIFFDRLFVICCVAPLKHKKITLLKNAK